MRALHKTTQSAFVEVTKATQCHGNGRSPRVASRAPEPSFTDRRTLIKPVWPHGVLHSVSLCVWLRKFSVAYGEVHWPKWGAQVEKVLVLDFTTQI